MKKSVEIKLVLPSMKYVSAYLQALAKSKKEKSIVGQGYTLRGLLNNKKDFPIYLKRHQENRKGLNLPKGIVPATLYWAVVGNKVVGTVDIRHKLFKKLKEIGGHIGYSVIPSERRKGYGTQMLALALPKVKKLGIKNALITCDSTNIGSKKIIENNGGKLINKVKKDGILRLRYTIKL